jgi:hypothetical protein
MLTSGTRVVLSAVITVVAQWRRFVMRCGTDEGRRPQRTSVGGAL